MTSKTMPNTDETSLSPVDLWQLYIDSGDYLRELTDRTLKKRAGIRLVDYKLLHLLVESPDAINSGELRMGVLSHSLRISPSRLTYQINSLVKQGLVHKCKADKDRRGLAVSITDKGYEIFSEAYEVYYSVIGDIVFKNISNEETAMLRNIYAKILKATIEYDNKDI
ncbi:MarR family winged helix-turn-helix transcriptional regulator [Rothia sp. ZJ932]|uniref:MarR family winged helix-turn-helix transcriptional regulator n=1 Tax=Rothia sp. ZJ932 TaxID=2810516 RepID=UPI0019673680|nr:MarR family transcriptional regulator [Rothia sp. ZJ932]QRZ61613.1 MarR family transcriptional regulator [Rothia sp. ZJ932]